MLCDGDYKQYNILLQLVCCVSRQWRLLTDEVEYSIHTVET
jgi:hypothetical protein